MANEYLTPIGERGTGVTVNRYPDQAMRLIDDTLRRATEENLDVVMWSEALREHVRDTFYKEVCGRTFADALRAILTEGTNTVRILVWAEDVPGVVSPELFKLVVDASQPESPMRGRFAVHLTGTTEYGGEMPHFLIAYAKQRSRWILRIEEAHPLTEFDKPIDRTGPLFPAAIFFGGDAVQLGPELLESFELLFNIAGRDGRVAENAAVAR